MKVNENAIKTFSGMLLGIPILNAIDQLNYWVGSIIMCIIFTLFYTLIDKITSKFKDDKNDEQKTNNRRISNELSRNM